jgi:hypothetical protein
MEIAHTTVNKKAECVIIYAKVNNNIDIQEKRIILLLLMVIFVQ